VSALQIVKSSTTDRCCVPGCNRMGKSAVLIAGYPLRSERNSYSARALLCHPCRKDWRGAWNEATGATALAEVEASIAALSLSVTKRTAAIFKLREELGFSAEEVAQALADTARGRSVEEILEGLVDGVAELEAVA
jgi:hypothetical protein